MQKETTYTFRHNVIKRYGFHVLVVKLFKNDSFITKCEHMCNGLEKDMLYHRAKITANEMRRKWEDNEEKEKTAYALNYGEFFKNNVEQFDDYEEEL